MTMPDSKLDTRPAGARSSVPCESAPSEVIGPATLEMLETASTESNPRLWVALASYFGRGSQERVPAFEREASREVDPEDFSSEHGYEPGFEGRSEFEHGEFERWV